MIVFQMWTKKMRESKAYRIDMW